MAEVVVALYACATCRATTFRFAEGSEWRLVFVVVVAAAVVELSELFCASESSGVRSD